MALAPSEISPEAAVAMLARGETFWVDIDSRDPLRHAMLAGVFHFHPLAIEDTLNVHTRVKAEEYDGYLFVVLRSMRLNPEVPESAGVGKLCLFIGERFLVSVHAGASPNLARAGSAAGEDPELLRQGGPGRVAHLICDSVIDGYFPILNRVDEFVERLDRNDIVRDAAGFDELLRVRRLAFAASRSIRPQRDIFNVLAHRPSRFLTPGTQLFFRDVFDHVQRITDSLDAYRELISETTEARMARSSMRFDYATTLFSAIATIAIPFLLVSEFYGMNVRGLPLADRAGGVWIILALEALASVVLFAILRRRALL